MESVQSPFDICGTDSVQGEVVYPDFDAGRDRKFTEGFCTRLTEGGEGLQTEIIEELLRGDLRRELHILLDQYGCITFRMRDARTCAKKVIGNYLRRTDPESGYWHQDGVKSPFNDIIVLINSHTTDAKAHTAVTGKTGLLRSTLGSFPLLEETEPGLFRSLKRIRRNLEKICNEGSEYSAINEAHQVVWSINEYANSHISHPLIKTFRSKVLHLLRTSNAVHIQNWQPGEILVFDNVTTFRSRIQKSGEEHNGGLSRLFL